MDGPAAVPDVIVGDRLYASGSDGLGGPAVEAFALGGCGAATCAPLFTAPVPPPPGQFDSVGARIVAASDDGQLFVRRTSSFESNVNLRQDLVVLTADGAPAWTLPLTRLGGVAIAGDTAYLDGDDATAALRALDVATGTERWRSDGPAGVEAAAGGLVYGDTDDLTTRTAVAAYTAAGCGAPTCTALRSVDVGTDRHTITGITVSEGTLFVAKAGPGDRVTAFTAP